MHFDWGKILGAAIGAALLALQVGVDQRISTHEASMERDVDRIEGNTVPRAEVNSELRLVHEQQDRVLVEQKEQNVRLEQLEREMNAMYQGMDNE